MPIVKLVTAIIETKKGILLLHKPKHDDYTGPGGKIIDGETDITALKREIKEEIGVDAKIGELIGKYSFKSKDKTFKRNVYIVKITKGTPKIHQPLVFSKLIYLKIGDALKLKLAPNIKDALNDYKLKKTLK